MAAALHAAIERDLRMITVKSAEIGVFIVRSAVSMAAKSFGFVSRSICLNGNNNSSDFSPNKDHKEEGRYAVPANFPRFVISIPWRAFEEFSLSCET